MTCLGSRQPRSTRSSCGWPRAMSSEVILGSEVRSRYWPPSAAYPARSKVTTPGGGLGNSSVPWPGRPLRPVGVGGFGEAERRKLADGERGQVLIQLRAGGGAGQHNRCPRLGQRGGQRNRVFGDTARRGQRGQRRRRPARRSQAPVGDRLLNRTAHPAAAAS